MQKNTKLDYIRTDMNCNTKLSANRSPSRNRFLLYCNTSLNGIFPAKSLTSLTCEPVIWKICEIAQNHQNYDLTAIRLRQKWTCLFFRRVERRRIQ